MADRSWTNWDELPQVHEETGETWAVQGDAARVIHATAGSRIGFAAGRSSFGEEFDAIVEASLANLATIPRDIGAVTVGDTSYGVDVEVASSNLVVTIVGGGRQAILKVRPCGSASAQDGTVIPVFRLYWLKVSEQDQ
jgi:hypothetical protein